MLFHTTLHQDLYFPSLAVCQYPVCRWQCPTLSVLPSEHANAAVCWPTLPFCCYVMMMFGKGQVMHLLNLTFHRELLISASITQHMVEFVWMCVMVGLCVSVCVCRWVTNWGRKPTWASKTASVVFGVDCATIEISPGGTRHRSCAGKGPETKFQRFPEFNAETEPRGLKLPC